MPNGLCEAPRLFTKLTKPIVGFLHFLGIKLVMYIDDILLAAKANDLILEQAAITVKLLIFLGFVINEKKSIMSPSKVITFLGLQINTSNMTFQLTNEKVKSIIQKCHYIQKKADPVTAREVAMVTGSLQFAINVIPMGNLHFRNLQKQISEATLLGDWDKKLVLNQDSISELDWWI